MAGMYYVISNHMVPERLQQKERGEVKSDVSESLRRTTT